MKIYYLALLLSLTYQLVAMETRFKTERDSIAAETEIQAKRKKAYEDFRLNKFKLKVPDINPFTLKLSINYINYQIVTQSDLYIISHDIYTKYYKNDILLWNFRDSAYLNLNLKDLQNSRGLIQLEIPLSNFPLFFKGEMQKLINSPR